MLLRIALFFACLALLVLGAEDYYKVCDALPISFSKSYLSYSIGYNY
jgi:hypothetical protein